MDTKLELGDFKTQEDLEWTQVVASAPVFKDPMTRLLDMLHGWAKVAGADEARDTVAAGLSIASLYQEAGQFAFDDYTTEQAESKIREFLTERVLPALMQAHDAPMSTVVSRD